MKYGFQTVSIKDLAPVIEETVKSGSKAELTVTGHSMMPLLFDRISRVRLTESSDFKRGDMVLYRRVNGDYVLHRIVRADENECFSICGDNQFVLETGVRYNQIIAKVDAFARRDRWCDCSNLIYCIWWRFRLADRPLRRFLHRGMSYIRNHINYKED